ncbi:MAG TPA: hypothetical protein VE130_05480 [Nitrososphaeraceae archaeon]|jgi:hypothetical protein|nr:hypothetical protein [Nitrososphaeraceae archaeon]
MKMFLILTAMVVTTTAITITQQISSAMAWTNPDTSPATDRKAPIAISGDNVYIV